MRSVALASLLALAVAVSGNSWLDCTRVALLLAVPSLVQGGGCHVRDVRGAVQLVDSAAGESASLLLAAERADSVYSAAAEQQAMQKEEEEEEAAAFAGMLWGDVRRVCVLAAPIIVSNVTVPLTAAVDVAIVGRLGHASYLGAVALGGLLFNYIYWGLGFVKMGTTGLTANAFGTPCY